jgi:hypothetical protein
MLDDERSAFDAEVRLQTFDPQGHLVASASGTIKGTRIEP